MAGADCGQQEAHRAPSVAYTGGGWIMAPQGGRPVFFPLPCCRAEGEAPHAELLIRSAWLLVRRTHGKARGDVPVAGQLQLPCHVFFASNSLQTCRICQIEQGPASAALRLHHLTAAASGRKLKQLPNLTTAGSAATAGAGTSLPSTTSAGLSNVLPASILATGSSLPTVPAINTPSVAAQLGLPTVNANNYAVGCSAHIHCVLSIQ